MCAWHAHTRAYTLRACRRIPCVWPKSMNLSTHTTARCSKYQPLNTVTTDADRRNDERTDGRTDERTNGRRTDERRTDDGRKKNRTKKIRRKNSDKKIPTKKFGRKKIGRKKNWGQGTGARHGRCGGKARVTEIPGGRSPPDPPRGARHG